MADPIVEQIAQNIVTTLGTVTVANDYNQTLTVERRKQLGNTEADNKAILFQDDPEKIEGPQGRISWRQRYGVALFAVESETSSTAIDKRLNQLRSDVEKVLMVDPFRNSLAVDTIIQPPEYGNDPSGRWEVVVVYFDVHYRTAIGNPYSLT